MLKNRILIVDDEPDIVQVLKMGLEDNGMGLRFRLSGSQNLLFSNKYQNFWGLMIDNSILTQSNNIFCSICILLKQIDEFYNVLINGYILYQPYVFIYLEKYI
jgi:CheY-like chemotaxis protein